MTDRDHIDAIAEAFNRFMRQLEVGDHRDSMDNRIVMNRTLRDLRDAVAEAQPTAEIVSIEDARALAHRIAEERIARNG